MTLHSEGLPEHLCLEVTPLGGNDSPVSTSFFMDWKEWVSTPDAFASENANVVAQKVLMNRDRQSGKQIPVNWSMIHHCGRNCVESPVQNNSREWLLNITLGWAWETQGSHSYLGKIECSVSHYDRSHSRPWHHHQNVRKKLWPQNMKQNTQTSLLVRLSEAIDYAEEVQQASHTWSMDAAMQHAHWSSTCSMYSAGHVRTLKWHGQLKHSHCLLWHAIALITVAIGMVDPCDEWLYTVNGNAVW